MKQNIDAVKEQLKVDLEKLKIVSIIVVVLTGGLIGLLFKSADSFLKEILFTIGSIAEVLCIVYLWKLNNVIKYLLDSMGE